MLCFVYQKIFGAFPVFHLIIQLFKIATHNPIAKVLTHLLACVITVMENTALFASTSLPCYQPSGRSSFLMRLRQKGKSIVALLQQIHLPSSFKKVLLPKSHTA